MTLFLDHSKYRCPACGAGEFETSSTQWRCAGCRRAYACVYGIPKLLIEETLGLQDRKLRKALYDGVFGRFYQFMMPFIVMPVRPWSISWPHWAAYGAAMGVVLALIGAVIASFAAPGDAALALFPLIILGALGWFLIKNPYLFHLLVLAVPARLSLDGRPFTPKETFAQAHERLLSGLRSRTGLQVLDVSTGSCNSLYRHGWMTLDAAYTAIDLSETMLRQGSAMMSSNGVPVDLVLGDALALPFQDERFDVVLSYGALNGLSDPSKAVMEMTRVLAPGGVMLFLDEQLYDGASRVERRYFERVLSSHNVIHRCPVEDFPQNLTDVHVSQVYQFYYICTAKKAAAHAEALAAGD